jgi:hypothetical protein
MVDAIRHGAPMMRGDGHANLLARVWTEDAHAFQLASQAVAQEPITDRDMIAARRGLGQRSENTRVIVRRFHLKTARELADVVQRAQSQDQQPNSLFIAAEHGERT